MGNTSTNFKNKWTDGVIWDISSLTCIKHAKLLMKKMPDNQCPKEFESSQRPSHSEEEEETVGELAWRELMQSSRRGTRYDQGEGPGTISFFGSLWCFAFSMAFLWSLSIPLTLLKAKASRGGKSFIAWGGSLPFEETVLPWNDNQIPIWNQSQYCLA